MECDGLSARGRLLSGSKKRCVRGFVLFVWCCTDGVLEDIMDERYAAIDVIGKGLVIFSS